MLFLSDLHNNCHGQYGEELTRAIHDADADLILIGGDILIQRSPDTKYGEYFAKSLKEYPVCCYTNGNHESGLRKYHTECYRKWVSLLREQGITLLNNC